MSDALLQLWDHVRLADVLDIVLIAALAYFLLAWFRERGSRSLALATIGLIALYAAARWLELYLTMKLFQSGILVLALSLVVVFQQDIRRAFQRAASWRPFRREAPEDFSEMLDTLAEVAATCAEHRIGALIVLAGQEPLDALVRGGVSVEGQVSLPLLHSVFHPASPGHDGAVLIEDGKLRSFALHLPLSKNVEQLGQTGTRHAAALGLAEICDALVIVVSEERGTISVAHLGTMREISGRELRPRLDVFYRQHLLHSTPERQRRAWRRDLLLKGSSLVLACIAWIVFAYRVEPIQRTFVIPVEYRGLPQALAVDPDLPRWVEVTLSGPQRAFEVLDTDTLRISLDLSHLRAGDSEWFLPAESLELPPEVAIQYAEPSSIIVTARQALSADGGNATR